MDSIFNFFDGLLKNFTWSKFTFIVFVLLIASAAIFMYESYTGSFRLERIKTELEVIESLVELEKKVNVLPDDSPSKEYFNRVINNTEQKEFSLPLKLGTPTISPKNWVYLYAPWLLFLVMLVFSSRGDRIQNIAGIVLIGTPFAIGGYYLPYLGILSWIYPWACFVLFMIFIYALQRRKGS